MMTPESLIQKFRGTVSPPIMYLRLNEAINHPDSSLDKVGKIISEDSSLSARLLKLVNSSFYGFPRRIEKISEAVFLVGSHQVRDIALVTTVMDVFKGIPKDLINTEDFWLHSLACGTGSKLIAELMGQSELERYFLLGVMHDIGRIILFSTAPDISQTMLRRSISEQQSLTKIEQSILGFTHADIGKILIDMWRLPGSLQEVVSYHHKPEWAIHYPIETATVHTADVLSHALQLGSSGEPFVPMLNQQCWEKLHINQLKIPSLMERIEQETKAIAWLSASA
jgi:HD-like signal output (HDOD) protein